MKRVFALLMAAIVFTVLPSWAQGEVITDPNQLSPGWELIDFEEGLPDPITNPFTIGNATFSSEAPIFFNISHWPANGTEIENVTLLPGGQPADSAVTIEFASPVSEILLGWGDPNFEGNVLQAYDADGQ